MARHGSGDESTNRGWLGKREAVWPSGPIPNKDTSKWNFYQSQYFQNVSVLFNG